MLLTAAAFVVLFLLSVFIANISATSLFRLERKGLPGLLAMLLVIGVTIAAGAGVTVLMGTSIREFIRDIPKYTARISAEVQPLVEWLSAKGMSVPTGRYMSYFEPGAAVQIVADLLKGFGKVLGNPSWPSSPWCSSYLTRRVSRENSGSWPTNPAMHWIGSRTFGRR